MNKDDLKLLKDHFGENFSRLCREQFPTLLEKPGLLYKAISNDFADNHSLYNDIIEQELINEFRNYIYNSINETEEHIVTDKTPTELLNEKGYILYECKTEEDIQSFKKYYRKNEELCTFRGGRLENCYVFFAVKKNVEKIKRKNFTHPERQDEYGTSVISIQFYKGESNEVSIKNRYNHTVKNPDATFSNNLENIIPGLTESFNRIYNLSISYEKNNLVELINYVKANDKKFYKYNYEINNIYYCPNNIIIDNGEILKLDKSRYIVFEYFLLDLKQNIIVGPKGSNDCFISGIKDIKKIQISKIGKNKIINIVPNQGYNIEIFLDEDNKITCYKNNNIKEIGDNFLFYNEVLTNIELKNVEIIGNKFLYSNEIISKIILPKAKKLVISFLINVKI